VDHHGRLTRIGFTGDHGRRDRPILKNPERFEELDYLITESTYGDRRHPPRADLDSALAALVNEENQDGGRILIPAFAVGRTQVLVYTLGKLQEAGRIPRLPIFVDSPMATAATKIIASHPECFDTEIRERIENGEDPFYFEGMRYVASVEESMELNSLRSPHVIISASGMIETGRVLHHLKQSCGRQQDCLLIVGYMAEGTLGRRLLEGATEARIFGEVRPFRMKVRRMNGLSAHADYHELLEHIQHLAKSVRKVFVVHGEERQAFAMRDRLQASGFRDIEVPVKGQKIQVAD
jgi:metallo-beta-lactamase family protein